MPRLQTIAAPSLSTSYAMADIVEHKQHYNGTRERRLFTFNARRLRADLSIEAPLSNIKHTLTVESTYLQLRLYDRRTEQFFVEKCCYKYLFSSTPRRIITLEVAFMNHDRSIDRSLHHSALRVHFVPSRLKRVKKYPSQISWQPEFISTVAQTDFSAYKYVRAWQWKRIPAVDWSVKNI